MSTPPDGPRRVKIANDERGGWSSDRPRRDGAPPRPADLSVRCRVLRPSDRLRYSPGSLVVIVSPSPAERDRFIERTVEDRGAVLSLDKVRGLLAGRVPEAEVEERAVELLDAAVGKRLQSNQSVVIAAEGIAPDGRERFVRIAARAERPRHMILLDVRADDDPRAALNELRRALDAGELGGEGFQTALRLGGASLAEVNRLVFRPPASDD